MVVMGLISSHPANAFYGGRSPTVDHIKKMLLVKKIKKVY